MRKTLSRHIHGMGILALVAVLALLIVYPTAAGDTLLSNNSGDGNAVFFIDGEPSVVINGFDLTPLGVALPVALDAVSISVQTAVPGANIDLLVYQDGKRRFAGGRFAGVPGTGRHWLNGPQPN